MDSPTVDHDVSALLTMAARMWVRRHPDVVSFLTEPGAGPPTSAHNLARLPLMGLFADALIEVLQP